jgi:TetR/AcrR family transcriptional regulator, transcriptional repressor of bet genes
MPRPSNREQRRAQIVDGLRVVMAERGYDGASIAAIARQAGLASGLVHYHFGSKEEILLALVEHLSSGLHERLDQRLTSADTPWARLDAWIDAHLALGADSDPDAVACWVAIGAEAVRRTEVRHAYEAAVTADLDQGESLVAAILTDQLGPESTGSARLLATGLLAAIEGSYRLAAGAPSAVPVGFAAPSVRAMARGLIGTPR